MIQDFNVGNPAMITDFCQFNMASSSFDSGIAEKTACYDLFFRSVPDGGGFVIAAGLRQAIDSLRELHFTEEDITYLRSLQMFNEAFLEYLRTFRFCCDVWAVPEGTPVFPHEPILTVRGPLIQAQMIETVLINSIGHQSLIATKANRIVRAAEGREVYESGTRRAHGASAAFYGSRAAFIGGCCGTTQVAAAQEFGIPAVCSMTHSWVEAFDSELDAFAAFARDCPNDCVLLLDTYNTLQSGVPNAIKVFNEVLRPMGVRPKAIRIDSGDITYLSKKVRRMLDDAGYADCRISVTNSLDEAIIRDVLLQGAKVDIFGVGERLITSASAPVLGMVYKLSAVEENGELTSRIKISDNITKITLPGFKTLYRLFDRDVGKAIADVVTLNDEEISEEEPYELFDSDHTWKRKTAENFVVRRLLQPIFVAGKCVYASHTLPEIQKYCRGQVGHLWEEVLRFEKPHNYYVDLSQKLWDERQQMLARFAK